MFNLDFRIQLIENPLLGGILISGIFAIAGIVVANSIIKSKEKIIYFVLLTTFLSVASLYLFTQYQKQSNQNGGIIKPNIKEIDSNKPTIKSNPMPPSPTKGLDTPSQPSKKLPLKPPKAFKSPPAVTGLPKYKMTPSLGSYNDETIRLLIEKNLPRYGFKNWDEIIVKADFDIKRNSCFARIIITIKQGKVAKNFYGKAYGLSFPSESPAPSKDELRYRAVKSCIDKILT